MLSHSHSQAFLGICWKRWLVITENVQIFSSYTNQKYNVNFYIRESKSEKCSKEIKKEYTQLLIFSHHGVKSSCRSKKKRITARRIENVSWKEFEASMN